MSPDHDQKITVTSWHAVQQHVYSIAPTLAACIDTVANIEKWQFIKVRYAYGDTIIRDGMASLPDPMLASPLLDDVNRILGHHNTMPVGIILTKSAEIFFETASRIIPISVLKAGELFGAGDFFESATNKIARSIWNMTAGARTVFSLAKISNSINHARLKNKFTITADVPQSLFDHYYVFKDIAKQVGQCTWYCDILFFPHSWLVETNSIYQLTAYYRNCQPQSCLSQYHFQMDLCWERFTRAVTERNWMPKPIVTNTLKHLLAISQGIYPGFTLSDSDDYLPLSLLQTVYRDIYKLNDYPLIIMQPQQINQVNQPLYYSLSLPTLLDYPIISKNKTRMVNNLIELHRLINVLQQTVIGINCQYYLFHCTIDISNSIKPAEMLTELDRHFMLSHANLDLRFPSNSPFFKGCIQIIKSSIADAHL